MFNVPNDVEWAEGKVLVACEESQAVVKELRVLGIEAYSCDLEPCSGGHPEWHIQGDVVPLLELKWAMIVAFPPCTHLASSGARWFPQKIEDGRQQQGIDFFMLFAKAKCLRVAIENPVGIMSSKYRKPDQIVQPYQFGDSATKTTCLWLKNLPKLEHTDVVSEGEKLIFSSGKTMSKWYYDSLKLNPKDRAKLRSTTFPGIAKAMAQQWAPLLKQEVL